MDLDRVRPSGLMRSGPDAERHTSAAFTGCSMRACYVMTMKMSSFRRFAPALFLVSGLGFAVPAAADPDRRDDPRHRSDQDAARRALLDGSVMPFSVLKRRVEEQIGDDAQYLGSEFLPDRNRYRLKYMRDRNVMWVDVDGRTGAITGWAR